jgi:hypothetical protein
MDKIKLYHYSNEDFKGLIGSNGYPAGVLFYPVKIKRP